MLIVNSGVGINTWHRMYSNFCLAPTSHLCLSIICCTVWFRAAKRERLGSRWASKSPH